MYSFAANKFNRIFGCSCLPSQFGSIPTMRAVHAIQKGCQTYFRRHGLNMTKTIEKQTLRPFHRNCPMPRIYHRFAHHFRMTCLGVSMKSDQKSEKHRRCCFTCQRITRAEACGPNPRRLWHQDSSIERLEKRFGHRRKLWSARRRFKRRGK